MKTHHSGDFSAGIVDGRACASDGVSSACFFKDSFIERRNSLMSTFGRINCFGAGATDAGSRGFVETDSTTFDGSAVFGSEVGVACAATEAVGREALCVNGAGGVMRGVAGADGREAGAYRSRGRVSKERASGRNT
jgi:hypothetical protein